MVTIKWCCKQKGGVRLVEPNPLKLGSYCKIKGIINEKEFFDKCINEQRFPESYLEKQIVLKFIIKKFEKGKIYLEEDVNNIIKEFYKDFVLIRKGLISFGYIKIDKGEYKRLK